MFARRQPDERHPTYREGPTHIARKRAKLSCISDLDPLEWRVVSSIYRKMGVGQEITKLPFGLQHLARCTAVFMGNLCRHIPPEYSDNSSLGNMPGTHPLGHLATPPSSNL